MNRIELDIMLRNAQYFASRNDVEQAVRTLADVIKELLEEIEEIKDSMQKL